ncbi:hypothetical protein MKW94_016238 [Papaver nudicaule]|uniref:TF-B3 domain-containing protein n=1 Tax=Papaver nudicaule TaxID=74823 RepID=A0AA41VD07_PAPNU|nr:hypothetical protein [Papaver nudicaule]
MAKDLNWYEEARKQRIEDNKRRFQQLGVKKMANSLSDVIKKKNKTPWRNRAKVKSNATSTSPDVVRRSSRPRNKVSYSEGIGTTNCKTSYIARVATEAERSDALKRAESFQSCLLSGKPSFVKSIFSSNWPIFLGRREYLLYFFVSALSNLHVSHLYGNEKVFSNILNYFIKTMFLLFIIRETHGWEVHIFKMSNDIGEVQVDVLKNGLCSYIARFVTKAERSDALERAESFQSGLLSGKPSFVKSMSASNVSKFMLNIPPEFCDKHLPKETKWRIVLEDEEGLLYETNYNGTSGRISTGWKAFCMDHKLGNGDALVIELIEPTRFKVHIFRVPNDIGEGQVLI